MNPIRRLIEMTDIPPYGSTAMDAAVHFVMGAMGSSHWDPATLNRAMTSAARRYKVDINDLDKSLEGRIREASV